MYYGLAMQQQHRRPRRPQPRIRWVGQTPSGFDIRWHWL
jgi:hypothetical protein